MEPEETANSDFNSLILSNFWLSTACYRHSPRITTQDFQTQPLTRSFSVFFFLHPYSHTQRSERHFAGHSYIFTSIWAGLFVHFTPWRVGVCPETEALSIKRRHVQSPPISLVDSSKTVWKWHFANCSIECQHESFDWFTIRGQGSACNAGVLCQIV